MPDDRTTRAKRPNNACPQCGGELTFGYGLAGGGMGAYDICLDCEYFDKPQPAPETEE